MNTDLFEQTAIAHYHSDAVDPQAEYPHPLRKILSHELCETARDVICGWNGYEPTALQSLQCLAEKIGVAQIHYKDEGSRFGLGSFKALGGAYAVLRLLALEIPKHTGSTASDAEIGSGRSADAVKDITIVTATDGNHGRSVAWACGLFGCRCVIYIHAEVSKGRAQAMEALGADVIRIDGNYDESVHRAAADAAANGWHVVSDTSYEGYTEVPRQVMAGYTVMTTEIAQQMPDDFFFTHVFVQGGVGGLAGAICAHNWQVMGIRRPRFIIVEPDRADCLFQSAKNGAPTEVSIAEETVMAGLSCGEVSRLSWEILRIGADDFLTISDNLVAPTMRLLAGGVGDDKPIVAGESAVAGLAALIAIRSNALLSDELGINGDSRILVFGTEGATDVDIYESIVGRTPEDVLVCRQAR
jgi:diaminopropionate ammonia-lyase